MNEPLPQPQSDYSRAHALLLKDYYAVVQENINNKRELTRLRRILARIARSASGVRQRKRRRRKSA